MNVILRTVITVVVYCLVASHNNRQYWPPKRWVRANEADYPHAVLLLLHRAQYCSGSIISNRVVITAAHCVVFNNKLVAPTAITVTLGPGLRSLGGQYRPCHITPHPNYNEKQRFDYFYDVALILLLANIQFTTLAQKIPIVNNSYWQNGGTALSIAGFGFSYPLRSPFQLHVQEMIYVPREECMLKRARATDHKIERYQSVPRHVFCMVPKQPMNECHGDSGSSVVWDNQLVGLVTVDKIAQCGSSKVPTVFINLYFFKEWIRTNVMMLENLNEGQCRPRSADYL